MALYEYDSGLRQTLINNTTKDLCRLEDLITREKSAPQRNVRENLNQFYDTDTMAVYAENPKMHISNDYVGCLFIRGILDHIGPNEHELSFKGPTGIIQPRGISYQGNTWIVPINQLIEALAVNDYKKNPNPYNRQYLEREFEFGTISGLNMGKVRAYEPFGAFLKFIDSQESLRNEISQNKKTTPIKLLSISDISAVKYRGLGCGGGTGTGFAR
ncbi:MAG: hypothetical protein ACP5OA_00060 [Candidatus Woesearchaeota archaeon]